MVRSVGTHLRMHEIAVLAQRDADEAAGRLLLVASVERGTASAELFEGRAGRIFRHVPSVETVRRIADLWLCEDEADRWRLLLLRIEQGGFEAELLYPEEIDPEEDEIERRGRLIARFFGTGTGAACDGVDGTDMPPVIPDGLESDTPAGARAWLQVNSARTGIWDERGALALPSGMLFVGDPLGDGTALLDTTQALATETLTIWLCLFDRVPGEPDWPCNTMLWLEASGLLPVARGVPLDFAVDAAFFALGDVRAAEALVRFAAEETAAGRDGLFDWMEPMLEEANFAKWLTVPGDGPRFFIATTREDGSFAAVPLYDAYGTLSGVLIDIWGRESDGTFLDQLLPVQVR